MNCVSLQGYCNRSLQEWSSACTTEPEEISERHFQNFGRREFWVCWVGRLINWPSLPQRNQSRSKIGWEVTCISILFWIELCCNAFWSLILAFHIIFRYLMIKLFSFKHDYSQDSNLILFFYVGCCLQHLSIFVIVKFVVFTCRWRGNPRRFRIIIIIYCHYYYYMLFFPFPKMKVENPSYNFWGFTLEEDSKLFSEHSLIRHTH